MSDDIDKYLADTRLAVKRAGRAVVNAQDRRESPVRRVENEPPTATVPAHRFVRVMVEMAGWKKAVLAAVAVVLPVAVFAVLSAAKERDRHVGNGLGSAAGAEMATGPRSAPAAGATSAPATATATSAPAATTSATSAPATATSTPSTTNGATSPKAPAKRNEDPYGDAGARPTATSAPSTSAAPSTTNAPSAPTMAPIQAPVVPAQPTAAPTATDRNPHSGKPVF